MASQFKVLIKVTLSAVALLILAGCESTVVSQIETFRNDDIALKGDSIAVRSKNQAIENSLEFRFYKEKLESKLKNYGFNVIQAEEPSDFVALLGYSVNEVESEERNRGSVYLSSAYGRYGYYRAGGGVLISEADLQRVYDRRVSLEINKSSELDSYKDKAIQISVSSKGHCEHLSVVFDEILDAVFANLERDNGSVAQVKVPGETKCR